MANWQCVHKCLQRGDTWREARLCKNKARSALKSINQSNKMLDLLALLMVNPSSQGIASEPALLYNTQLSPSWQAADFIVSFFFFFPCTLKAEWISSWADTTATKEHTSALCLGRSLWGRSGFIERSLAQQVRGGLQWRCSDPSSRIPREKTKQQLKSTICTWLERIPTRDIIMNRWSILND